MHLGALVLPPLLLALLLRSSPNTSGCVAGVELLRSAAAASSWVVAAGRERQRQAVASV